MTLKKKPAAKKVPGKKAAPKKPQAKAKVLKRPAAVREDGLTVQQRLFVLEYLVDLNATQAAVRAGYSPKTARSIGQENLTKPAIRKAVDAAIKEREQRTEITADRAVREVWAIATADPRELVEYRVGCCRHCWGQDHRYQRTAEEYARAEAAHAAKNEELIEAGKPGVTEFDPQGGIGYDGRRDPHPNCPECFGLGVGRTVFKDTRKISPAAAALFAGVKETREGTEIKLHSKDAALDKVFRHLGLYNDKIQLTMPTAIVKDLTGRKD